MSNQSHYKNRSQHIYRVDKFAVPDAGRPEFLEKVRITHERLRTLPGFIRDVILEQVSETAEFNIVTIVKWENSEAIKQARVQVHKLHKELKFDPKELFTRLGILADFGNYRDTGT
ncbi:MAG: hypothetical protein JJU37_03405 [Balneolaceae bacterium]|nr:hypothetical protein [Balneolaceae bacterium]